MAEEDRQTHSLRGGISLVSPPDPGLTLNSGLGPSAPTAQVTYHTDPHVLQWQDTPPRTHEPHMLGSQRRRPTGKAAKMPVSTGLPPGSRLPQEAVDEPPSPALPRQLGAVPPWQARPS